MTAASVSPTRWRKGRSKILLTVRKVALLIKDLFFPGQLLKSISEDEMEFISTE